MVDAEDTDDHSKRRLDPNRKRGNGKYVREWAEIAMPRRCQGHECRCSQGGAAFDNWYTAPDDTESCSSCDSEYTKTIPWTRPAAHREPLTPTSLAAPLAPLASDADADAEDTDVNGWEQETRQKVEKSETA